jgi:hypothetical protein
MPDDTTENATEEPELAPYLIEGSRSSRARCKTCRRKIDKGVLRLGIMIEGPFGQGYMWHHLTCAAKRRFEDVEEAYGAKCWDEAVEVPDLDELAQLREKAAQAKAEKKEAPYVERAPSARSKCKHCDEGIDKGELRVVLLREVVFGRQIRGTPINVHARCVAAEIRGEDCLTEVEGFEEAVNANSRGADPADIAEALTAIGELG